MQFAREGKQSRALSGASLASAALSQVCLDGGAPDEILWNFEKFLVNRQGEVVARSQR